MRRCQPTHGAAMSSSPPQFYFQGPWSIVGDLHIDTIPHLTDLSGCFEVTLARGLRIDIDPRSQQVPLSQLLVLHKHRRDGLPLESRSNLAAKLQWEFRRRLTQAKANPESTDWLRHKYEKLQIFITPIHVLPTELLTQIFMLVTEFHQSPTHLMTVCGRWHHILVGMAAVWASLYIGTWTDPQRLELRLKRAKGQPLKVTIDTEIDIGSGIISNEPYLALTSAAEELPRWNTLVVKSLPHHGDTSGSNEGRFISCFTKPMTQLVALTLGNLPHSAVLRQLLTIITRTVTANFTYMEIHSIHPIGYFGELVELEKHSVFRHLTTLSVNLPNPVGPIDFLPYLDNLQTLELTRLHLRAHPADRPLPCATTLRLLSLRKVSVQWVYGYTFNKLERLTLIDPLPLSPIGDTGTKLPVCKEIFYESRLINPLTSFYAPVLLLLSISNNQWSKSRGDAQALSLSNTALESGRLSSARILHLTIECSDRVLIQMLLLLPQLEELFLTLQRPSALGSRFFDSLLAKPTDSCEDRIGSAWYLWAEKSGDWRSDICPSLRLLELRYEREARLTERSDHLLTSVGVAWSRQKLPKPLTSFHIFFGSQIPFDLLKGTAEVFRAFGIARPSGQQGTLDDINAIQEYLAIVVTCTMKASPSLQNYLTPSAYHGLLRRIKIFQCTLGQHFPLHHLYDFKCLEELFALSLLPPDYPPPPNLPIFRTLQKLTLQYMDIGWINGQRFSKLEECTFKCVSHGMLQWVDMPRCVRLEYDGDSVEVLGTFQLPQIRTLTLHYHPSERSGVTHGALAWQSATLIAIERVHPKVLHLDAGLLRAELLEQLDSNSKLEFLTLRLNLPDKQIRKFLSTFVAKEPPTIWNINHPSPATSIISIESMEDRWLGERTTAVCSFLQVLSLQFRSTPDDARQEVTRICTRIVKSRQNSLVPLQGIKVWWERTTWAGTPELELVGQSTWLKLQGKHLGS